MVGHHEEVDPRQALAVERVERAHRQSAQLLLDLGRQVGGQVDLGLLVGEVLGLEVVELVVAARADLGGPAGLGLAVAGAEHAALDLARADHGLLDEHLGVVLEGQLEALADLGGVVDLADADAGAAAGGLGERREAQRLDPREHPGRVGLPLPAGHRDAGGDGQPGGGQHDLHEGLVHADRRGEHAGADVAHAGHLEHPLQGAVLAPRAVQQREDHVDLADDLGHLRGAGDDEVGRALGAEHRDHRRGCRRPRAGRCR